MNKHPEDNELIELFLQGGSLAEKAFKQLSIKYGKAIYVQVYRMVRNDEQTKDVVQNILIKIWTNLSSFRQDSSLYSWIFRITHNEALNFLQKEKRRATVSLDTSIVQIIPGNQILDLLGPEKITELLMQAIQSLPEKQALVFQLKYFQELKYTEIADLTGTSEGALKASFHLASQKIEEFLKKQLNLYWLSKSK